jgi:hypothetical protein
MNYILYAKHNELPKFETKREFKIIKLGSRDNGAVTQMGNITGTPAGI